MTNLLASLTLKNEVNLLMIILPLDTVHYGIFPSSLDAVPATFVFDIPTSSGIIL